MCFDAARLFCERAAAAGRFRVDGENASNIAELCRRLDGLPLALELAASRASTVGVTELLARLDDRFALLSAGRRTTPPRHQTLRAAVAWSHELLSVTEQMLFPRLSCFAGGFTIDAVEGVCGGEGLEARGIVSLLATLVDKSLVMTEDAGGVTSNCQELWMRFLDQAATDPVLSVVVSSSG